MNRELLTKQALEQDQKDVQNTFVIPVAFDHPYVEKCIKSIHKYNEGYRIILIDQTPNAAMSHLKDMVHVYISVYRNLGFAKAMNMGIQMATTPYITLCNDDIEFINKRWFPAIVNLFDKAPNILAINPASVKDIHGDRTKDWMPYKEEYSDEDYDYLMSPKPKNDPPYQPSWVFEGTMMFCTVFRAEALKKTVGLLDEGFYPGCFTPKSKVLMGDFSYKKIEDIKSGDTVISHLGNKNKVNQLVKKDFKGELLKIQLVGTTECIECTPDHKFFTVSKTGIKGKRSVCWSRKDKQIVEKAAKDIQERDLLIFPKIKTKDRVFQFNDYQVFLRKVTAYKITNNHQLFKIFGYFLAEGNYIKKSGYYSGLAFTFNIKEKEYIQDIVNFCFDYEIPYRVYHRPEKTISTIEIYSAYISRIFLKLLGEYSHGKFIHPDIMQCSNDLLKELFLGYHCGDGCISKGFKKGKSKKIYKQISIKTVSRKLAECNHILLLKLNIPHLIYFDQKNKRKNNKDTHDIYVSQTYFSELFKTINNNKAKRNEVFKENDTIFYPIKKITKKKYSGNVYDLNVNGDHSYIIDQVAAHNSGEDYDWCIRCYSLPKYKPEKGPEVPFKIVGYNGSWVYHHWLTSKNKFNWEGENLKKYRVWPGFREKWMTEEVPSPNIYGTSRSADGKERKGIGVPTIVMQL